jgi:hypothetical protein
LHWVITTKKELLPQIKADKGIGEMDADKYLKHLHFRYRDKATIPEMISPAKLALIYFEMLVYPISG